jgi:hypothetical protein
MTSKMFRASVKTKADEAAGRWRLSITLEKCHPPPGPAAAAVGTRSAAPGRASTYWRITVQAAATTGPTGRWRLTIGRAQPATTPTDRVPPLHQQRIEKGDTAGRGGKHKGGSVRRGGGGGGKRPTAAATRPVRVLALHGWGQTGEGPKGMSTLAKVLAKRLEKAGVALVFATAPHVLPAISTSVLVDGLPVQIDNGNGVAERRAWWWYNKVSCTGLFQITRLGPVF